MAPSEDKSGSALRRRSAWSRATPGRRRGRELGGAGLGGIAVLALIAGLLTGYLNVTLFDADRFADRVSAALEREEVADEIARKVTDDLVLRADRDLIAVRPLIESVTAELIEGKAVRGLTRLAVHDLHRAVFEGDVNTIALTLADIGVVVRSALERLTPKLAKEIPRSADTALVNGEPPAWVVDLARTAEGVRHLAWVLLGLALVCALAGLIVALDRRRWVSRLGIAVAIAAAVAYVGLDFARARLLDSFADTGVEAAADAVWDVFLSDLMTALVIVAASGAILAAAARSMIAAVPVEQTAAALWRRLTTAPEATGWRIARALALVALGIVVVTNRDTVLDLVVLAAGIYVLYKGVEELLRMVALPPEQVAVERARRAAGRRALLRRAAPPLIAVALIAVLISVFVGVGGVSAPSRLVRACNGSAALCDRPLDQVVLAGAHNAMSGADVPGYLFPSQDRGIPAQLDDGIHALLIDTHYGSRATNGTIRTELPDEFSRQEYVEALGEEGLDAALRIRDRLVVPDDAPTEIYMCHRFCELGAVPLVPALRAVRDFLVANPGEVLVIVNEDYVEPEDFLAAVEESGLGEYVYRGPVGPPWPTLREMIASGERALLMAENRGGGADAPWYRDAYGEVLQETPFSFKRPELLTDPDKLAASCKPNRGDDENPLLLVNHWIDTSPAPRPSNAEQVNAARPLLRRAALCRGQRGLLPNVLAVDFYGVGDLFEVVDTLNGTGHSAR